MIQLELHSVFYHESVYIYKAKKVGSDIFYYIRDVNATGEEYGREEFKQPIIKTADLLIRSVFEIKEFPKEKEPIIVRIGNYYSSVYHFIVLIKEVIDKYNFLCYMKNLGEIKINCKREQAHIKKGMIVEFYGELSMEIIDKQ